MLQSKTILEYFYKNVDVASFLLVFIYSTINITFLFTNNHLLYQYFVKKKNVFSIILKKNGEFEWKNK